MSLNDGVFETLTSHMVTNGIVEKMRNEVTWTCVGLHYPPYLSFTRLWVLQRVVLMPIRVYTKRMCIHIGTLYVRICDLYHED